MYLGIDLGTSGIKVLLLDAQGQVVASHSEPLTLSRPHPLWSEQDPAHWWQATDHAIMALGQQHPLNSVKAIGLSGQMHGATLLDAKQRVLRPAILWNDGRSYAQCGLLEQQVPTSRQITGNLMMPGFTAPKLLWVQEYEPEIFSRIDKVLLPKDYLRLLMTGDFATEMSDASGTAWLDVAKRDWDDQLLAATGLTRQHMPTLYEGNQITGQLLMEHAKRWGMQSVPVVAGGGDNAAGAIGVGLCNPGQAMLSLGTSGVYFVVCDGFMANTENAVHSFCHSLPQRWHLMSVMLSAASCLDWAAKLLGIKSVPQLIQLAETAIPGEQPVTFLPYLSGERTPHNNPNAKGVFFGMTHQHGPEALAYAVMEGVGFALAEGIDAVHACGVVPESISLIGGGARSSWWRQMLADISGQIMEYRSGAEVGPALGAARLAAIADLDIAKQAGYLTAPKLEQRHTPDPEKYQAWQPRRELFRQLYTALSPLMSPTTGIEK